MSLPSGFQPMELILNHTLNHGFPVRTQMAVTSIQIHLELYYG